MRKGSFFRISSYFSRSSRSGSPITLWLIFTLWSLILTYPLALHLTTHLPLGDETAATVPLFNLWTLQWNIEQLRNPSEMAGYWDAPIFAPELGTFAFSEPQPLTAWLALPLWGFSPILAYNFVLLLFLTMNGWFTYWLLRQWHVSSQASLGAGLLMAALPAVMQELGVLQLTAIFGYLWTLLFLSRWYMSFKHDLALALGPAVIFLTCGYYGLFSLIFLPLAILLGSVGAYPCGRPNWGQGQALPLQIFHHTVFVILLSIALTAPFPVMQQQQLARHAFQRSATTIEQNSAHLNDYFRFLDYNIIYGQILGLRSEAGQRLFSGMGIILLAIVGAITKPHRFSKPTTMNLDPHPNPLPVGEGVAFIPPLPVGEGLGVRGILVIAIGLAWFLSFGLRLHVMGYQPYQWLRDFMPGFAQLRSPFRFAIFMQLHLALLAGLGLDVMLQLCCKKECKPLGLLVCGAANLKVCTPFYICLALVLAESLALPLPLLPMPPPEPVAAWETWLNEQPQPLTIVMLPFAIDNGVAAFEPTVRWMLRQPTFQAKLINGYSGFFPPDHAALRDEMIQFPTAKGIAMLRAKGVTYLVVDYRLPQAPQNLTLLRLFWDEAAQVGIYRL